METFKPSGANKYIFPQYWWIRCISFGLDFIELGGYRDIYQGQDGSHVPKRQLARVNNGIIVSLKYRR